MSAPDLKRLNCFWNNSRNERASDLRLRPLDRGHRPAPTYIGKQEFGYARDHELSIASFESAQTTNSICRFFIQK